jgi:hypothetical protein
LDVFYNFLLNGKLITGNVTLSLIFSLKFSFPFNSRKETGLKQLDSFLLTKERIQLKNQSELKYYPNQYTKQFYFFLLS